MMDLTGFQPFDFSIGSPSVTITNRGVTFNQATVKRLNMAEYVQLLINHEEGQVAVRSCSKDDEKATSFYHPKKSGVMFVRWNRSGLLYALEQLLDSDLTAHGFRVEGRQIDAAAVLFDFRKAKPLG